MYLNESILGLGTTRTKCDAGKDRSAEQAAEAGVGGHERRTGWEDPHQHHEEGAGGAVQVQSSFREVPARVPYISLCYCISLDISIRHEVT